MTEKEKCIEFAQWLRDNTIADGAPKLFLRSYLQVNQKKSRYTIPQLYDVYVNFPNLKPE